MVWKTRTRFGGQKSSVSEERKAGSVFPFSETDESKVNPRLLAQTSGYRVGLFTEIENREREDFRGEKSRL